MRISVPAAAAVTAGPACLPGGGVSAIAAGTAPGVLALRRRRAG